MVVSTNRAFDTPRPQEYPSIPEPIFRRIAVHPTTTTWAKSTVV
jgi:hypothetical protein